MLQSSQLFQLTSSRREWREHPTQQRSRVMHFNSHPHEEDDEADCSSGVAAIVFQLTSSRRGWLVREAFIYYTSHFNSHPHEEDDNVHWWRCCISEISTHILTKRMTRWKWLLDTWPYISTHILTKRMTRHFPLFLLLYHHFNSHPHEEDDQEGCICIRAQVYFNSHPHEEDDVVNTATKKALEIFQLTSSRRGWLCGSSPQLSSIFISTHILTKRMTLFCLRPCRTDLYFNSHPHEEDDHSLRFCIEVISISTHILTKRMT